MGADEGAESDVEELETRIEILTRFARGIIFEFDREGHYLNVWSGEASLLARPIHEVIGKLVSDVFPSEEGQRFHAMFHEVYDTGVSVSLEYTLDVPAGRRTFVGEAQARDRRGVRTILVLVRDVTRAKDLEAKLVQAERLAALGLLAASVGHEIRQPLAYLLASAEVLERELAGTELPPRAREPLDNIRSGAGRIAEITSSLDLLANQRRRATTTFDIHRPMRAALDLCASEIRGRARPVLIQDEPLLVRGDEGEMSQVFANLLLNAAHAIPPEQRDALVRIRAERRADKVIVRVEDSGAGIPVEVRSRVFDPFFTTKAPGRGTGLGLFIARRIVEAHQGTVEVSSTTAPPNSGTTVTVTLPHVVGSDMPDEPTTGVRSRAFTRQLKLLVVDDEPRFLTSLRMALDGIHEVTIDGDSGNALALVKADPSRFDAVVCDLSMPVVDGARFYAGMKELGLERRFILMTGGAYTADAVDFVAASGCTTIVKPFLVEALLDLLEKVTRVRSAG